MLSLSKKSHQNKAASGFASLSGEGVVRSPALLANAFNKVFFPASRGKKNQKPPRTSSLFPLHKEHVLLGRALACRRRGPCCRVCPRLGTRHSPAVPPGPGRAIGVPRALPAPAARGGIARGVFYPWPWMVFGAGQLMGHPLSTSCAPCPR